MLSFPLIALTSVTCHFVGSKINQYLLTKKIFHSASSFVLKTDTPSKMKFMWLCLQFCCSRKLYNHLLHLTLYNYLRVHRKFCCIQVIQIQTPNHIIRYMWLYFYILVVVVVIIIIIIIIIIPGNHDVKELQKTAILGTAHILRKVLT